METDNSSENRGESHTYGDQTVASFNILQRLPMIGITALAQYELGLLNSVTKDELNQILSEWRSTPWKTDSEIETLKQKYIEEKRNQYERDQLRECTPTSVPTDSGFEECHIQKRKRVDGEV